MSKITERITRRLAHLTESVAQSVPWKDPSSANYDRQWAEDALFHTVGPLTNSPRWVNRQWNSDSEPVPGFNPGGPAPQWSQEEVVMAMAGDPKLAFTSGGRDNPRSPQYGHQGGAPLWRMARRIARKYRREDPQFISDLYSTGFIPLMKMMQPGYDESREPFISYVTRTINGAMEHGVGGSVQGIRATGGDSKSGIRGLKSLIDTSDPEEAREIASQIKGDFQSKTSHDKHADNPFGGYSPRVYQMAMRYADALETGNPELIATTQDEIKRLMDDIDSEESLIPGASTGLGQAISTGDRSQDENRRLRIASMDVAADEEKGPMAGNIPSYEEGGDDDSSINQETIFHAIDIAMAQDLTRWITTDEDLAGFAAKMGLKPGEKLGKITANELRYLIRSLGPLGSKYPGKGKPRKGTNIPRDGKNWWQPLEDPELEPIPNGESGAIWRSIWTRGGYLEMGPTEIAREMTEEVREFQKLGIPTARKITAKAKTEEAVSKVAVSNALQNALLKLKLIIYSQRESLGIDESKKRVLRNEGFTLLEDYDPFDRRILLETLDFIVRKVTRNLVEDSPPGYSGTVERMKEKGMEDDKAFAIAWSMYKKGDKPHKKPTKKGDKYVPPSERKGKK